MFHILLSPTTYLSSPSSPPISPFFFLSRTLLSWTPCHPQKSSPASLGDPVSLVQTAAGTEAIHEVLYIICKPQLDELLFVLKKSGLQINVSKIISRTASRVLSEYSTYFFDLA